MIAEFLNRQVVLDELAKVRASADKELTAARTEGRQPDPDAAPVVAELAAVEVREAQESSGQPGYAPPKDDRRGPGQRPAPLDDFSFFSRDPIVGLFQSALEESLITKNADEIVKQPPTDDDRRGPGGAIAVSDTKLRRAPEPQRKPDGRRIFDKFSITDVRWVRSLFAEGVRLLRHRHDFNERPGTPVDVPERFRLVVVGDWGTGLPRAQKVGAEMRKVLLKGQADGLTVQHVVHLGDVYYSGWEHEYRRRFLPYWPVHAEEAGTFGSWSLNGNHDMYCGGHAYFDVLLMEPRFARQQQSSFFSFVNRHWKILGLDTAWDDAGLRDPQATWINDEIVRAPQQVLLLSHHQPFSAYEGGSKDLVRKIDPILQQRRINGWFWGHEHRCMLYREYMHVPFGRCIGHGGVPVYMWHGATDPYPAPGEYEYRKSIKKGLEHWGLFGFAVMDFNGPSLKVTYIDENGVPHKDETLA